MFVMDMPDVPPQYAPVVIAQAFQAQKGDVKTDRTIGICTLMQSLPNLPDGAARNYSWIVENQVDTWGNSMSPALSVQNYFRIVENQEAEDQGGRVSVLENPKHGTMQATSGGGYYYIPEPGYLGKDRVTFLVEVGGRKIKAVHFLEVSSGLVDEDYEDKRFCPKGRHWKISSITNDPTGQLLTFNSPTQLTSYLARNKGSE